MAEDEKIDNKEIPIEYIDYQGKSEEYVIYFNTGSLPFFDADDKVRYIEMNLEIHVYSKGNYLKIVDYIKEKMEENDFLWQSDEEDIYEQQVDSPSINKYQQYYNENYNRGKNRFDIQRNFQQTSIKQEDTKKLEFSKENLVRGIIANEYLNRNTRKGR